MKLQLTYESVKHLLSFSQRRLEMLIKIENMTVHFKLSLVYY